MHYILVANPGQSGSNFNLSPYEYSFDQFYNNIHDNLASGDNESQAIPFGLKLDDFIKYLKCIIDQFENIESIDTEIEQLMFEFHDGEKSVIVPISFSGLINCFKLLKLLPDNGAKTNKL